MKVWYVVAVLLAFLIGRMRGFSTTSVVATAIVPVVTALAIIGAAMLGISVLGISVRRASGKPERDEEGADVGRKQVASEMDINLSMVSRTWTGRLTDATRRRPVGRETSRDPLTDLHRRLERIRTN